MEEMRSNHKPAERMPPSVLGTDILKHRLVDMLTLGVGT
jgi:hypothetical protein